MIGNSLLTQVGIAGLAIGIIVTYIQPTFTEIKNRQDEITQTKEELAKVNAVNQRLNLLYSSVNEIPQTDRLALATYIPDELDEVKVLRDLSIISGQARLLVTNLKYSKTGSRSSGQTDTTNATVPLPKVHSFDLSFTSPYESLKEFLSLLEKNNYPLDITEASIAQEDSGQMDVVLKINTYSVK
ncbi:MAG: hypothetical protein R3B53_03325 [Candidatus Paceibacterota bacterium]